MMNMALRYLLLSALILIYFCGNAQEKSVVGFWQVEAVEVGKQNMTPVAKWFKIINDGTYQAGNGWLQNGQGKWKYDIDKGMFSAVDPLEVADEFGDFSVSFKNEKMMWERAEEGMQVKITLVPINGLPMSPADYLKGVWDLVEITENDQSIISDFDKENEHKLFFRWDRVYINFNSEGKKLTGYWHIHGHKPEITLLPHQAGSKPESWRIEVDKTELMMIGVSDSNGTIKRKYVRSNAF